MTRRKRGQPLIVSLLAAAVIGGSAAAQGGLEDPWPFWGRTTTRLGNTTTIGPQTPRIDWSMLVFDNDVSINEASPVMDRFGRVFINDHGMAAIDSYQRSVLWKTTEVIDVSRGTALADGRVVWGDRTPFKKLRCHDAETGEEIWHFEAQDAITAAPVIREGIVYVTSQIGDTTNAVVYARQLSDGSEVWTRTLTDPAMDSPSLLDHALLTSAGLPGQNDLGALNPADGSTLWTFNTTRTLMGVTPIVGDRAYVGSTDRFLYAVDLETGEEIWRFDAIKSIRGAVAVGHDGTIYAGTGGGVGFSHVFAVSPEGDMLWDYDPQASALFNSPVVGGDGTIYLCVQTPPSDGFVVALRPDGTKLWRVQMPHQVSASPMLAPDGTLYVISRDNNLYAFRDLHERMGIDNMVITTGTVLAGGATELSEPDDEHLVVRSGFGRRLSELHKMELIVRGEVETVQPHVLRLQLQSRISEPAGVATVRLRNWDTGAFETVAAYPLSEDEPFEWIQIPEGGNAEYVDPSRYIHPFGQVELQLTHVVFAPFLAFQFDSFIDQIKIEAAE